MAQGPAIPKVTATDLDIRDLTSISDSVSAVQSGTWNVTNVSGTVSLPTGASTSAKQDTIITHLDGVEGLLTTIDADTGTIAGAVSGTEMQVDIVGSLPAGSNAIGKLSANSGVDIGDVDVTSVIPGTGATNLGKAIDTATGATDTGVLTLATRDDALSTLTPAEGDNVQLRTDSTGALWVKNSGTVTVDGSAVTQPVSNAGLTELAAAINANKVDVNIVSSDVATGGTSAIDDADFTATATSGTPSMGVYESTPTSVTDGDMGIVGITAGRRLKTSATIDTALPAGTNAIGKLSANSGVDIGDVDVTSISAGDNTIGRMKLTDGTDVADILDLTNSNPLTVAIVDGDGTQISSFGGGTQYTEDAASAANPVGTAVNLIRSDTPATQTTTDGDNVAQRGTNYGAAYVQLVTSTGSYIDSVGGGTEYTEDVATANPIVGKAIMIERDDALSTVTPVEGDNIGLRGTAEGALWTQDFNSDAILADTTAIKTAVEILDNAIAGSEMQVDIVSSALPTGASTLAEQQSQTTHLATIAGDTTAIETAVQLIDDTVATLGTTTYTETSTKGLTIGAVRRDADTTLVDTTNEIGPLQMNAAGQLKVEVFSGETLPVSMTSTTVTGTVAVTQSGTWDEVGINDSGNSITVDYATTGSGTATGALRVELPTNGTGVIATVGAVTAITNALPAGTNNIGDVDILSIAAGDNNIGNVDVVTVPSDPFGANADAAATAGSTGSMQAKFRLMTSQLDSIKTAVETLDNTVGGSELQVDIVSAPTLTVNAHAVTNAGTFAVQVDGNALTALQLIDDPVIADDAAFTPATTKVMMAGFEADETSTDSVDEGDGGAARMTLDRKIITTIQPHTAGGLSVFNASSSDGSTALTNSAQAIKASAGQLYGWYIYNPNSSAQFVQLYNTAAASVTVGTTSPLFMLTIPATSAANVEFTNGITFSNAGWSCAATSTAGGNGAPTTALDAVFFYK